ncbi:regulation of nuclear pre-mRNA domain-containing protein 1b [Phtheirospermum japonicum]|uniref:Regulation of nuclear pre-mRNA domain-containing protein 1b n=1 Tax=Phtheirospermum japonicum TaxID=374723 RepID=A0A830CBG5_9LAMI|nr:regulation of nuclear pre-mRNA domain-containing protein 1b [Phtheirospermum japonicum]
MNSVCSEQSLADKFSKLNSTQQCIETLSHWCIFHRSKAELVVSTWDKQFHNSDMVHKVPLLYLANDILQNSKRKGNEFVTEFWKVLPSALKEVVSKGDERGKNVVSRLVGIWEERRVFGSRAQSLKDVMLGEELPPPLELRKKRSRSVRLLKKDSRSIKTKLSIGGPAEKIVSAFHVVLSENTNEDEEMGKCKSAVHRVKKIERDVDVALTKAKDPSRKTLSKELEEEENLLKQCIEKLKGVETNRVALVSQLRDALHEQESELENLRTQMQAQVEEATNMRTRLDDEERVFDPKPLTDASDKTEQTSKKSAAAIAAEVADKLAASTSSQYIMSSVLSTFAAQEAQSAGLTTSTPENPNNNVFVNPAQNNNPAYQSVVVGPPSAQIPNSQAHYQSIPNNNPPPLQYMQQQPAGGPYDYGSLMPPQPGPPSYMVSPMVPLMQQQPQQQMLTMGHQQQSQQPPTTASFRPLAPVHAPGMVYYMHPYRSQ